MYVCTTYKQVELAGKKFFLLVDFLFSNFLLLLEIQGEGSIVRFSFVVELEWNEMDLVSSHDSCRPLIFVFFGECGFCFLFRWQS